MDLTNFQDLLQFIIGGGSSVIVAGALAYLAENWSKWHDFPRWLKMILPVLVSALLAVGAQVLMGYADVVKEISPWYTIVAVAVMTWINSQKTYANTKLTGYGVRNSLPILVVEEDEDELPEVG